MLVELFVEVLFKGERNPVQNDGDWTQRFYFISSEMLRGFLIGLKGKEKQQGVKPLYVGVKVSNGDNECEVLRYPTLPTWQEFALDLRRNSTVEFPLTLETVCDAVIMLYGVNLTREHLRTLEQQ